MDVRVQKLPHPSFIEEKNILSWVSGLVLGSKSYLYGILILSFSLVSLIGVLLAVLGVLRFYSSFPTLAVLGTLLAFYFFVITGPIYGPKYRIPILPLIILAQSSVLSKINFKI